MRQHYLRAGHGSHRFAHLILLPAHVQMFLNPERTNLRSSCTCTAIAPAHHGVHGSPDSRCAGVRRSRFRSSRTPRAPHFVDVPPAHDVPSTSAPRFAVLHSSPGLTAAPAPNCPFRRMTLRVASTLYDDLRPTALFGALGALKELALVLAPNVGVHACARLLGTLGNMGAGLRLSLEGTLDEVSLKVLYKQVGSPLPNVQALRTLRLRTMTTEAAQAEEDLSHLAL